MNLPNTETLAARLQEATRLTQTGRLQEAKINNRVIKHNLENFDMAALLVLKKGIESFL